MTEYKDNSSKYEELRQQYPFFIYENFSITKGKEDGDEEKEYLKLQFFFTCNNITFTPYHIIYIKDFFLFKHYPTDDKKELSDITLYSDKLRSFVFNLGLIELISYWKATCSPLIVIKCGNLNCEQQKFWKKLWFNGLGEFFYLNNIKTNIDNFVDIKCESSISYTKQSFKLNEEYIVPIGGGKDSVVTLELLRGKGKIISPMVINQRKATKDCILQAGYNENTTIELRRIIDKQLLDLNSKGYLNGHTPFSAMLAFSTLICAVLCGKKYIALSNENSANEATVYQNGKFAGFDCVNHQYSKSLEFENDFRTYYKNYLCEDIEYFSFLRPISELKIAEIFSHLNYLHVFKSCNVGSKQDIWCGNCPKCLFAYIILSPFIDVTDLKTIFGKNMFEDATLLTYFEELIGNKEIKPFECVGTVSEVNMAIAQKIKIYGVKDNEILLKHWLKSPLSKRYSISDFNNFKDKEDEDNNLPEDLKDCFKNFFVLSKKSSYSKIWKDEKIAIMGLGREGICTLKLINEILPNIQLILYDENKERFSQINDLIKHHRCLSAKSDLSYINNESTMIFLTPAMAPKDYPQLEFCKLTNQCDSFLRLFGNQCIGVSGTKGKSTTSSLIYHIIKQQTDNCLLAGNIGIPFFEILPQINEKTKIILELSCHQLQLVHHSPHISVLLNLYEEHLDHYIDFKDYQKAKLNLLFQSQNGDSFIYNADDDLINDWINHKNENKDKKMSHINCIGLHLKDYKWQDSHFLKGIHNKYNILAAINSVKQVGISEDTAIKSALTFRGLQHRMQFIGTLNKVSYYDDSISTIPQATLAAVKSLNNVSTLILGGMDRGIDYSSLTELLNIKSIENIIFVGKAGRRMYDILNNYAINMQKDQNINTLSGMKNILISENWQQIAQFCKTYARPNTSVLLSPAASSYDQFRNFEHRGDFFKEIIFN